MFCRCTNRGRGGSERNSIEISSESSETPELHSTLHIRPPLTDKYKGQKRAVVRLSSSILAPKVCHRGRKIVEVPRKGA